jgi:hypothetical protein
MKMVEGAWKRAMSKSSLTWLGVGVGVVVGLGVRLGVGLGVRLGVGLGLGLGLGLGVRVRLEERLDHALRISAVFGGECRRGEREEGGAAPC